MNIIYQANHEQVFFFSLLYIFFFLIWLICLYIYLQFLVIFKLRKNLIIDLFSLIIIHFFFPQLLHIISILIFLDKSIWIRLFRNDLVSMLNKNYISQYNLYIEELKLIIFCFLWFLKNKLINIFNIFVFLLNIFKWIWYLIYLNLFLIKNFLYLGWIFLKRKIDVSWRIDWIKDIEDEIVEWDHGYSYLDLEYIYIKIKIIQIIKYFYFNFFLVFFFSFYVVTIIFKKYLNNYLNIWIFLFIFYFFYNVFLIHWTKLMYFFWQFFVWGRTNLFMLCYIEYYFYLILCIVDKLIIVEDEERKVAYGLIKEPGWFINPISDVTYEHFLKFKGISIFSSEFFIKKDKNWIIILLELFIYLFLFFMYFLVNFIIKFMQILSFFILKNIYILKFLYLFKFFIIQYFLKYDYYNSINYFKQILIFWLNLWLSWFIKHFKSLLVIIKEKLLLLLKIFEIMIIIIWNIFNIIISNIYIIFLIVFVKIIKKIINVKLFIFILIIFTFIKFQFLASLIIFLVSTFWNFYIESWNIPIEELFFDIRISNNYFLLDPKVYNLGNYKLICENISLSYNARKSQWYLIEHLRKKISYTLVFLRQLQKEYKYWFKAKCYDPLFFYIFYRLPYFFYYLSFSFCDNFYFFPICWYYFYLRINLPPVVYFYIIDMILRIILWICWGIKILFNKIFFYSYNIFNLFMMHLDKLNLYWICDFINENFLNIKYDILLNNSYFSFFVNLKIMIFIKQILEIYLTSLYNECLIWFLSYILNDILNMFNKNHYNITFIKHLKIINYQFIISIMNWWYYTYFQFIFLNENQISFENINLFKEFYFISALFQQRLEKSYLNYDLNRLNVFNFWAEEYFVTQTPLTIQTWKPRYRRRVPGAHEHLFKYAGTLNLISCFNNSIKFDDLIIGQKQKDFGINFTFWYNFFKNYQKINENYIEPLKFKININFNEWKNAHKKNWIFFFKHIPIRWIRRRKLGQYIHLNLHYIPFKINYVFLVPETHFINEFFWLFLKNFNTRIMMFSINIGQTNILNILESFGVNFKKYSIYLKWFFYDYVEVFDFYWSIFPYYKWIFFYQYLFLYIIAFWILNLTYFFHSILYCPITSTNSEYNWKKFRDSNLLDLFWMFKGINKKVKNYLLNSKNIYSKEYSNNNMFEDEAGKLYESLVNVEQHAEGYEFFNAPQADSRFLTIPRTKWLIKASRMLRERSRSRLFDFNFNFIKFYNNSKYENFYNNLVTNHLQVGGFLAYGSNRNIYIKQANFGEAESLEALPVYFNARYIDSKEIFDSWKLFFWNMDKVFYKDSLPYWSLHKDMFSFQLSGINEVSLDHLDENLTEDEKERKILDNRYFIVDEDPHDFYYITFWFFFIPLTLFLTVYWRHHWLGFFSSRKVFDFFLYDYLSHFDLMREFSNSIGSNYLIGETSWWKFGSYYSASKPRMRKKRHLSFRPLLEGFTMIGEYMVWEAKIFVSKYSAVNFLLVLRSLYELFLYFIFFSFFLFIQGYIFGNKLIYFNIEKGALLHQNKFIKLFLKLYIYITLTYNLKKGDKK